jgi:peptidoglycan/LPS O-acetylase OafA/YrhL
MGSLRFILAFTVLDIHAKISSRPLVGGETAVQMFFLISGFYMAMVLHETYSPGRATLKDFWLSRAFRIFPAYYAVLLLTVCFGVGQLLSGQDPIAPIAAWRESLWAGWNAGRELFLFLMQSTLMGLDALYWMAFSAQGRIQFTPNFWHEIFPAWRTLLLPQAWTLSLELYFYLLAPFIVRRSLSTILLIMATSLGLRLGAAFGLGLSSDPWSYRFFPFEALFFLSGVLAYRLVNSAVTPRHKRGIQISAAAMLCLATYMSRIDTSGLGKYLEAALLAALFLSIAALFRFTRSNRFDRLAGELSYPMYVSHVLVVSIVGTNPVLVMAAAIAAAVVIFRCIDRPIDGWRHRRYACPRAG